MQGTKVVSGLGKKYSRYCRGNTENTGVRVLTAIIWSTFNLLKRPKIALQPSDDFKYANHISSVEMEKQNKTIRDRFVSL